MNSLVIQWLRHLTSTAEGTVLLCGWVTKILQSLKAQQKKKKKKRKNSDACVPLREPNFIDLENGLGVGIFKKFSKRFL